MKFLVNGHDFVEMIQAVQRQDRDTDTRTRHVITPMMAGAA